MTQNNNSMQEKKLYTPVKVSLLGNISELTQAGGFSGAPSGMMGMMDMMSMMSMMRM